MMDDASEFAATFSDLYSAVPTSTVVTVTAVFEIGVLHHLVDS